MRVTAAIPKKDESPEDFTIDQKSFNGVPTDDPVPILRAALADNGLTGELANRLLDAASYVSTPIAPALALAAALDTVFDFEPLGKLGGRVVTDHGLRRATLLIGPPGSGKTVTAAKMAARAARAGNGVRLLTIDTLKTGGIEHLKTLADALGVGMKTAQDPRELAALIAGSMGDISIIDSSGINPFDSVDADHLAEFIDAVDAEPVLVMPAGLDSVDAIETAHAFARLKCRRMIVTRVDMTRRLGSILECAYEADLTFSDVSVSPEIIGQNGGGLGTLNPVALARLMLPALLLHEDGPASPGATNEEERVSVT
ncbi:MAG: GTPase [Alphaproteobacteria bacterium]|nr:GTPase [Alphaproteobacteria bacterium]